MGVRTVQGHYPDTAAPGPLVAAAGAEAPPRRVCCRILRPACAQDSYFIPNACQTAGTTHTLPVDTTTTGTHAMRRRVPTITRAARAAQERLAMMKIDPAWEPLHLAALDRMRRLRARRARKA